MVIDGTSWLNQLADKATPLALRLYAAVQFANAAYYREIGWQSWVTTRRAGGDPSRCGLISIYRPEHRIDAQVGYVANDKVIVIAYRGTPASSLHAWLRNFETTRTPFCGGHVHSGMLAEWDAVQPELAQAVERIRDKHQEIVVVGHSKGGGLAQIDALHRAHSGGGRSDVITFGSPRVLSPNCAAQLQRICNAGRCEIIRCVHDSDAVTLTPASLCGFRYKHIGRIVFLTEDNRLLVDPSLLTRVIERVRGWRFDAARDHFISEYIDSLVTALGLEDGADACC